MSNPKTPLELVESWLAQARESAAATFITSREQTARQMEIATLRGCARELREILPKNSMGPVPHNGTDTSAAAAVTITDRVDRHKEIMDLFRKADSIAGLTCGQVEDRLPHRTHQSVSARIRELVKGGKLVDSGHRRKNPSTGRTARVYVPTCR